MAWRALRYLLTFPIWGDEAFVSLNLLDRDYLGLLRPLEYKQVAPVLFLWAESAVYHLLGGAELALRLLPFLAGLGSLALFWRLARSMANEAAWVLSMGILAVAYYPVRHSCEIKPYSFDLLMSLALLVPAANWLRAPEQLKWLLILTAMVPVALGASYPAVFVAGTVTLVLLPAMFRTRGWKAWSLYLAYNLALLASFFVCYRLIGTNQFQSTGGTHNWYWSDWFPPAQPWPLVPWLVAAHTGNMMAYPIGGSAGASTLTFLLCLLGVWHFCRKRHWDLLSLCLGPFALTLLAATLHRYPYGGSARIAQHLAPAICLLAGTGVAAMIGRLARSEIQRRRWVLAACSLLFLVGIGGISRDLLKPYKSDGDRQVRQIVTDLAKQASPEDQIVVMDGQMEVAATFRWYLRQLGDRVAWDGRIDWNRLETDTRQVWCLCLTRDVSRAQLLQARMTQVHRPHQLTEHSERSLQLGQTDETLEQCEVFHWVCLPAAGSRD
jgi:4-amino-4-deoxy-L-arabinose transferase-like glycosyltransferase